MSKKHTAGTLQLTSVKVFDDRYIEFRKASINSDMTLQKLVNRSISLYLTDPEYKKKLDEMLDLQNSGSSF